MAISPDEVVTVSISVSSAGVTQDGLSVWNIITNDASLPDSELVRAYTNLAGVGVDFSSTSPVYKKATAIFAQNPQLKSILVSRWVVAPTAGSLKGGSVPTVIGPFNAVTAGTLKITIDGAVKTLTAMDFSSALSIANVVTIVQGKLTTASAGSTFVFDAVNSRFTITSPTTGATSVVGFPDNNTTNDTSILFGLNANQGAVSTAGLAVELLADGLTRILAQPLPWNGFSLALINAEPSDQNILDASAFAQANDRIYGFTTSTSTVPTAATTDIVSQLKALKYKNVIGQYDTVPQSAGIESIMSFLFSTNFNGVNTVPTTKFKAEPGIGAIALNETQRQFLLSKNCNYYTNFGDRAMFAEGVAVDGTFIDQTFALQWFRSALQTQTFNYLASRPSKISQTDAGVATLIQQLQVVCAQAVTNGLLAPGIWNGDPLGSIATGDTLTKGYYIFAEPVATLSQADRAARKAPPITILAKGSGAIHFVDILGIFEP